MAEAVSVVPSSTGLTFSTSAPPEIVSVSVAAPVSATASAPSSDVAPVIAPSKIATLVTSSDVATVTAPTISLSSLPSPAPVLPPFPLSSLAFYASAFWFLNTSASAVMPGVA